MAINVNISDTVHLRDIWSETVVGAGGIAVSIEDIVHLRDDLYRKIDAIGQITKYIEDAVHLRDDWSTSLVGAGGLSVNLTETVHLRDDYSRTVELGGIWRHIFDEVHLRDDYEFSVVQNIIFTHNNNISFGETKEPGYKEYSHRFRWTNYNGIAVPDLNYKDLKEPIVRIIPAPSFLQFKYGNSFIIFTRNTINRFILKADVETGQWRAETDNLIEEFRDLGLMEPKTLVLAGNTLFGLSEKGVWKWNKQGMDLISDKIIDLPDAGIYEYIAFYSSIRNQYILHRQESSGTYLQLTVGTPVAPPIKTASSAMTDAKTAWLSDTKFVVMRFEDSDTHCLLVGEVDNIALSVGYGINYSIGGKQYAKTTILDMENGTSVIYTYDQSGTYRKVGGATISGLVASVQSPTDCADGNYDGGVLIKFTETTFAVILRDTGTYQTGSVASGVVTLNALKSSGISYDRMKSVYVGNGISVIAYVTYGGNIFVRTVEDNGDGTIDLGTALDTTIAVNNGELDIKVASSTLLLLAASSTNDLKTVPLTLTDTTLTKGTVNTNTGFFDNTNMDLAIANKGESGLWLFFEDASNSNYLTAMWGGVSPVEIVMAETIKSVIQNDLSQSIEASAIVGGKALLHYNEGNVITDDGYSSVWGLDYAAIDSYVYQIDKKVWYKFLGMDILDVPVILSGGSLDENYNLWLNSDRVLMKYPGSSYTVVEASIRTKEFYIEEGVFQRWMIDFDGSGVNVETRVKRMVGGSNVNKEDIKYSVSPNKWRGISLKNQRGRTMSIKIIDANIIRGLSFDIKRWGEE